MQNWPIDMTKQRMRARPCGGPHPLAPDHDEDRFCAIAGCVPIPESDPFHETWDAK